MQADFRHISEYLVKLLEHSDFISNSVSLGPRATPAACGDGAPYSLFAWPTRHTFLLHL
jgi:hypothetical protein